MHATLRLAATLAVALALAACARPAPSTPSIYMDLTRPGSAVDQSMAAAMISEYRRNAGLGPVVVDPRLSVVAAQMAATMARADDVRASLREAPLRERLARAGYTASASAENVSAGYRTLSEAFSGWRGSRPHDATMKLAGATHIGIATVHRPGARYPVFWTLVVAGRR